jgi:hypothetical protein
MFCNAEESTTDVCNDSNMNYEKKGEGEGEDEEIIITLTHPSTMTYYFSIPLATIDFVHKKVLIINTIQY